MPVSRAFFGVREPSATAPAGAEAPGGLFADGSMRLGFFRRSLTLRLINRGRTLIPLGAAVDEYHLSMADGRRIRIHPDFLSYPASVAPGEEQSVRFQLPYRLDLSAVTGITAKFDAGKIVIAFTPLPAGPPPPSTAALIREQLAREPIWRSFNPPAPPVEAPPPAVSAPVPAAPPPAPAPPLASHVPVTVEFEQMLGRTQRITVQWDGQGEPVELSAGDRRLFQVAPGPHQLAFTTRLAPIRTTQGQVPLMLQLGMPVRVLLEATARPTGTEVRARAWRGRQIMVDQRATPQ